MASPSYSADFKRAAVQKYFNRGNRTLPALAAEIGVSKSALREWVILYKKYPTTTHMNTSSERPQDWTPEQKLKACREYENLTIDQQGEFLRRKGLHSNHIQEWQKLCLQALSTKNTNTASKTDLNDAQRKIKELELDLARKNHALAETSALLILKKKADLIWGSEDAK